jgi:hypothetical protein
MLRFVLLAAVAFLPVAGFSNSHPVIPLKKNVITITLNPNGMVYMGPDTISTDQLAEKLQERLWRRYLGNDRMYDEIQVVLNGEVLMGVKGAALDAIQLAQKNALRDICLQKFKKLYENIDPAQQRKLQRQFPVLFQEIHW